MSENQNTQPAETSPVSYTPHDNTYRILLRNGSNLIIPVINEMFGENFETNENIIFFPNEHFNITQGGEITKDITDSYFKIGVGKESKGYLVECQSTNDNSMIWRVIEYGEQIGFCEAKASGKLPSKLHYPNILVLYLRYNNDTPNEMPFFEDTGGREVEHKVRILKIKDYNLSDIFQKDLFFLLPYYIFNYNKKLDKVEKDNTRLSSLLNEFAVVARELEKCAENGRISEYQRYLLYRLIVYEVDNLAKDCKNIKKGVHNLMGGELPKFDIDYILEEGIEKGRAKGIEIGEYNKAREIAFQLHQYGDSVEKIAKVTGTSVDNVQKWLNEKFQ